MNQQIHLVLFSNCLNDQKAEISLCLEWLQQIIRCEPHICLTIIETDHPDISAVRYRKDGNASIISVPCPENKIQLSAIHSLPLITYARRVADILYSDLLGKPNVIFWANSVDYVWLFQALKEHYKDARFMYVHHRWSWMQYLNVSENIFSELWQSGDITRAPRAFELTAYEQKMALIADKLITVSDHAARFFCEVLHIPAGKISSIKNSPTNADIKEKLLHF